MPDHYDILWREDGSRFYLCKHCINEGWGSNDEDKIIKHIKSLHYDEAISMFE